jgi:hypothetical protein
MGPDNEDGYFQDDSEDEEIDRWAHVVAKAGTLPVPLHNAVMCCRACLGTRARLPCQTMHSYLRYLPLRQLGFFLFFFLPLGPRAPPPPFPGLTSPQR